MNQMSHLDVDRMLEAIRLGFTMTQQLTGVLEPDARVVDAMSRIPRDEFVPERNRSDAFDDHALSIGYGQTISQPFIVALMSTFLRTRPHHRVLEIGTGSGYQTAVLAELVDHVYSIEIIPELATRSRKTLENIGYSNVTLTCRDGSSAQKYCIHIQVTKTINSLAPPFAYQGGRSSSERTPA